MMSKVVSVKIGNKVIPVVVMKYTSNCASASSDYPEYVDFIEAKVDDVTIFLADIGFDFREALEKKHFIRKFLKNRGFTRGQRRKKFSEIARELKEKGIIEKKAELCGIYGALSIIRNII